MLLHMRNQGAGQSESANNMDIQHGFEICDAHLFDWFFAVISCVIDQNINLPMLTEQAVDPAFRFARVGNIKLAPGGFCSQFFGGFFGRFAVQIGNNDLCAAGDHTFRHGIAQTAGGTSNKRRFVFQ